MGVSVLLYAMADFFSYSKDLFRTLMFLHEELNQLFSLVVMALKCSIIAYS